VNTVIDPVCSITSMIDTKATGLYSYPLEVFGSMASAEALRLASNETRTCDAWNLKKNSRMSCPIHPICPLTASAVELTRKRMQAWNVSDGFCSLAKALHTPGETVRVIVFGGSVTIGKYSEGCFCRVEVDKQCHIGSNLGNYQRCSWSFWFAQWLGWVFPSSNITLHNLARDGWSTAMLSSNINLVLKESGINEFTENDIIFIDESYNDAFRAAHDVFFSLMSLGRHIYLKSANYSWPTVVVAVQYCGHFDFTDYKDSYDRAAMALRWPMWSVRDYYNQTRAQIPYPFVDYLQSVGFKDHHPSWFVHLFVAELYAASFIRELDICKAGHGRTATLRPRSEMTPNSLFRMKNSTGNSIYLCDDEAPSVGFNARDTKSFRAVAITFSEDGRWKYQADRPGKFGWIGQLSFENETQLSNSSVTFVFEKPVGFENHHWILKLFLLKTYLNAGRAKFYLCGVDITGENNYFDAYWPKEISVPELSYFVLDGSKMAGGGLCSSSSIILRIDHVPISVDPQHFRKFQKVKFEGMRLCQALV
jgi:hypothetical protein